MRTKLLWLVLTLHFMFVMIVFSEFYWTGSISSGIYNVVKKIVPDSKSEEPNTWVDAGEWLVMRWHLIALSILVLTWMAALLLAATEPHASKWRRILWVFLILIIWHPGVIAYCLIHLWRNHLQLIDDTSRHFCKLTNIFSTKQKKEGQDMSTSSWRRPLWWMVGVAVVAGGLWAGWPTIQKMWKPPAPPPTVKTQQQGDPVQQWLAEKAIEKAIADKELWEKTKREDTRQGYQAYLKANPQGKYVAAANLALERAPQLPDGLQAGQVLKDCAECPEVVVIAGENFQMGGYRADEIPMHTVNMKAFGLGKYEVTVGEFKKFVQETGYKSDADKNAEGNKGCYALNENDGEWSWAQGRNWIRPGWKVEERQPVTCVSWNDAQAYVGWLSKKTGQGYRLPSESEWEYAARAGMRTSYYWGEDPMHKDQCEYANGADETPWPDGSSWRIGNAACEDGYFYVAPVGSFTPNGFGMYDMSGNVAEWVQDRWHDNYVGAPKDGSAWESGEENERVFRGGSWGEITSYLRVTRRRLDTPGMRANDVGFRVARTLP